MVAKILSAARPKLWKHDFRYSSPFVQVIILGIVCFLTPGMFNALNGMGGAGLPDTNVGNNANVALYACFAAFSMVAGGIVNLIGARLTIALGGATYALYAGALLADNSNDTDSNRTFVIVAGGILGIGAAMLWTGQGMIMMSYPREQDKGKFIGVFWAIFNMGGVIGAIIPLALNWNSKASNVSDGTYIGFITAMALASFTALLLLPVDRVRHSDGTPIKHTQLPSATEEVRGLLQTLRDWRILLLLPMFTASNWFYAYQFTEVNAGHFNVRTRAFNNLWYWCAQIVGAYGFGFLLDTTHVASRRRRGLISLLVLWAFVMATWACGLVFQLRNDKKEAIDLFDHGYTPKLLLYLAYGLNDAMFQLYAYWIMGSLTNDANKLARYAGVYKAFQSAGGAGSWRLGASGVSQINQFIICWALLFASFPGALAVALSVSETNYGTEETGLKDAEVHLEKSVSANEAVIDGDVPPTSS